MRLCRDILILGLLSARAWSAFVPVTLRQSGSSLMKRDVLELDELLTPTHELDLLYAEDVADGPPTLVTVSTKHASRPYVLVERFEELLSTISCSETLSGHGPTTLSMTFRDEQHLALAVRLWSQMDQLMFVTHHESCNHNHGERELYQSSSIQFDNKTSTASIACDRKEFGLVDNVSTSLRIRGGVAPRHVARKLSRRSLGTGENSAWKSATAKSFGFSADQNWADEENLITIPGQFSQKCIKCSSKGKLRYGFDINLPSLDPKIWVSTIGTVLQGKKAKPVFDTAKIMMEVVEPVEQITNIRTRAHTGVTVRWPGLIKTTEEGSKKPILGEKVFRDRDIPLFELGALRFVIWTGWGLLSVVAAGGAFDVTQSARRSMKVGESFTLDLMNNAKSSLNVRPQQDGRSTVTEAQAAMLVDVALGFAADLTVKVRIPDQTWIESIRQGGGRGPVGFHDGQISWYGGGSLSLASLSTTVSVEKGGNCPSSATSTSMKVSTGFGFGLAGYSSWAIYGVGKIIPRINAFPIKAGPLLYYYFPLHEICKVIRGKRKAAQKVAPAAAPEAPKKPPTFSVNDGVQLLPPPEWSRRHTTPLFKEPPRSADDNEETPSQSTPLGPAKDREKPLPL